MNVSKANDTRFWTRWRASGAVGSMPTTAVRKPAKAPKTVAAPKAAKPAKAKPTKRVKAATPPQTVPRTFGTRDLGKDASPRWAVVDKATKKQVETATSRKNAQTRAKELTTAAA